MKPGKGTLRSLAEAVLRFETSRGADRDRSAMVLLGFPSMPVEHRELRRVARRLARRAIEAIGIRERLAEEQQTMIQRTRRLEREIDRLEADAAWYRLFHERVQTAPKVGEDLVGRTFEVVETERWRGAAAGEAKADHADYALLLMSKIQNPPRHGEALLGERFVLYAQNPDRSVTRFVPRLERLALTPSVRDSAEAIKTSPCPCGAIGVERRVFQCPKCDEQWTNDEQGYAWERDRDRDRPREPQPRRAWEGWSHGICCIQGRCDGPGCECACHPRVEDRSNEAQPELFYACLNGACDERVVSHSLLCARCQQAWQMGRDYRAPEDRRESPPTSLFQRLLALWGEFNEAPNDAVGVPNDFVAWSGATKDLLLGVGLEWDAAKGDYVLPGHSSCDPKVKP